MANQVTNPRKLSPPVQRVLDVLLEHGDSQGFVDWQKLQDTQPGWDDTLPSMRFIQSTAERLRRTGRFAYEKEHRNGAPTPGRRAGINTRSGGLLPHNEKLLQLILKYGDERGKVNYKEMEKEVPRWWKHWSDRGHAVIALNSIRSSKRGKAELAKRNTLASEASALTNSEVVKASAHAGRGEITPEIRAVMDKEISKQVRQKVMLILQDCRYCPRCKKDMAVLFQGALVEQQHIKEE